jgi:polar amino acid transport system substrate-binding protein
VALALSQAEQNLLVDDIRQNLFLTEAEEGWLYQNSHLRVGVDPHFPPYTYVNDQGQPEGIVIDYLQIIGQALGVEFEFVAAPTWSDVMAGLRRKDLDVVATMVENENRRKFTLFTDVLEPMPWVIMSRDDNRAELQHASDLQGKRVAVVPNYASSAAVQNNYDIVPVIRPTPLDALRAVATGEADAYVGVLAVNTFIARTNGLGNIVVAGSFEGRDSHQSIGVRMDAPKLRSALDKALVAFSQKNRNQVLMGWMGAGSDAEGAVQHLIAQEKTVAGRLPLTPEEQAYVHHKKVVTMCVDPNWLPFEAISEDGRHIGIAADYMHMFSESIGLQVQLIPTHSWAESEAKARARKCDILSMLHQTPIRLEFLDFTDPFIESPIVFIARDDAVYIDGLKSMQGKTLAMVKGYIYDAFIREKYPNINVVYVDSVDEALIKISEGKIYATIEAMHIVANQIGKLGLHNVKIAGYTGFQGKWRVGVRNDSPILLRLFRKAVRMRDRQKESEIMQRWFSVRFEQSMNYALFWQLGGVGGLIFAFLLYRQASIKRYNRVLKKHNKQLEALSSTDALTGVSNRLKIDQVLDYEVAQADRYLRPLSVVLIDIDHFKLVNDTHGHQVGDAVLKGIAKAIRQEIRQTDTLGRWGGEEFMIICPETDAESACALADKVRGVLARENFSGLDTITASFGVAGLRPDDTSSSLVGRADENLYAAKKQGRNCVVGKDAP